MKFKLTILFSLLFVNIFAAGGLTPGTATTLTLNGGMAKDVFQSWSTSGSLDKAVCAGTGTRDQWYKFTATSSTHYFVMYTQFDGVLAVYTSDLVTQKVCMDAVGAGTEFANSTTLTIGQDYYIQIIPFSGTGTAGNSYSIGVTESAFCFTGWFDDDWSNSGNWAGNVVPTSTNDVVVPSSPVNNPKIYSSTVAFCRNLTINTSGTLTNDAMFASSGYLSIYGSVSNNGTLNHTGDEYIYLNGTSKTFGGSGTFTTVEIYLNNGSTTTLSSNVSLYGLYMYPNAATTLSLSSYYLTVTTNAYIEGSINFNSGTFEVRCIVNNPVAARWNCGTGTFYENLSVSGVWGVAGITWYNFKVNCPGFTYAMGCDFDVNGYFTLLGGAFNCYDGVSNYNLNVAGDFTNNATFNSGTGNVTFDGSNAQSINGTSTTTISKLVASNSSGSGLTLNSPVIVSSTLTFTAGLINTSSTGFLTLNDNVTYSGNSSTKYVNGPMKKIGNDAFIFPIGAGGRYRRLEISAPANASTEFTCQYFYTGSNITPNTTSPAPISLPLKDVAQKEYWDLTRAVTASNVTVKLYWEDATASGITNCADLTVAHFNGTNWVEEAATASGTCTGSGAGSVTTNAVVTSFSPFTFGSKSSSENSLPVEFISFTAQKNRNTVNLKWSTASELNNDFFEVEKSNDREKFYVISKVKGNGTTTKINNYKCLDESPLSGNNYYRIKQIDFNGNYTYSPLEVIHFDQIKTVGVIYPNPLKGNLLYFENENMLNDYLIEIYNYVGQVVYSNRFKTDKNKIEILLNNQLPIGIYSFQVITNQNIFTHRLFIEN